MATNVVHPGMVPPQVRWARGAALVLSGIAVAVALGLGLGSTTEISPAAGHPRVAEHRIVNTERPQDLAKDRAAHRGELSDEQSPVSNAIRPS